MKLNKYMKKDKGRRNKKPILVIQRRRKIIEIRFKLGKHRDIQSKIGKLMVNIQEITNQNKIQNELLFSYETLFRKRSANISGDFFGNKTFSELSFCSQDARTCESDLNELELLKALKQM